MAVLHLDFYKGEDPYSDGDIEERILEIARSGKIQEALSKEEDFAVLYHLSPVRENILSWYPFLPGSRLLEIGAGPGAITGLLCRKLFPGKVISVDLSRRRSEINYLRHRDDENLELYAGNLNDMTFPEKFDYVVLNGVFEYAGSFTEGDRPYLRFLRKCKSFLKPGGILLTAIENRFGLKYFSGAPEDHTGGYMDGLKGYPGQTNVRTFSRAEWEALAEEGGLPYRKFYYPWPDYKFPSELFTEKSLKENASFRTSWSFNPRRIELFPEAEMASDLLREGCYGTFANSFLIEMSDRDLPEDREILYAKMNADRDPRFRIQTLLFAENTDGKERMKWAEKSPLTPEAEPHIRKMAEDRMGGQKELKINLPGRGPMPLRPLQGVSRGKASVFPFLEGKTLGKILGEALDLGNRELVPEYLKGLREMLLEASSAFGKPGGAFREVFGDREALRAYAMVSPANIDLTFDNLIPGEREVWVIDCEWVFDFPVPVDFILYRAIRELCLAQPKKLKEEELLSELGITEGDRDLFRSWALFFEQSYVKANSLERWSKAPLPLNLNFAVPRDLSRLSSCLYLDLGQGFREEDLLRAEGSIKGSCLACSFEIEQPEKVRALRFDPLEGEPCICRLFSEEGSLRGINDSGRVLLDEDEEGKEGDAFLTRDPAYQVLFHGKAPKRLHIHGTVLLKDADWAMETGRLLLRHSIRIGKKLKA